ncbi:MAG: hypothetical protein LC751_09845 [Actinobacteria bacterium]|nr:hypothetical protein [Actinomycetota bacterium]
MSLESALRGFGDYSTLERQSSAALSYEVPARGMERTPEADSPPSKLLEALVGELHALREAVQDQNKLLRDQAHRLQRLEAAAPLPEIAPADTPANEEAHQEAQHSPESSAADQEEGEEAKRTDTGRRVSGVIHPIMLVAVCAGVTVVSALYKNALLLTASVVVATLTFLFSLYYYYVKA